MALLINGVVYHRPLLVFALKEEAQDQFEDFELLFTGVGKINASYHLSKRLALDRPDLVLNLGTAGSSKFETGAVVNATAFVQRDMDVTGLGVPPYVTPFESEGELLTYGLSISELESCVCGSGDNFETAHTSQLFDTVDMEAYALALISRKEKIPFLCLKFISDGANDKAATDWKEALRLAAKSLSNILNQWKLT